MSHRVTTQTEIKDKEVAISALRQAGWTYAEEGATGLRVTSGPMRNAHINLQSGVITGDTDQSHNQHKLGALRKFYAEQKFMKEALIQGHSVESREVVRVDGQERIRLIVNYA